MGRSGVDTFPGGAAEPVITSITASETSVTLADSNKDRLMLCVFNAADQHLYLKYGSNATLSSYTVRIDANGYFEMPLPPYSGRVDGVWDAGPTGSALVTELYEY